MIEQVISQTQEYVRRASHDWTKPWRECEACLSPELLGFIITRWWHAPLPTPPENERARQIDEIFRGAIKIVRKERIEIGPVGDPFIDGKLKALRHIREHGLLCECAECSSRGGTAREGGEKPYWILITENGRSIESKGIDDPFIHTTIRPRGLKAALFVLFGWMEWRIHVTGSAEAHRRIFGPESPDHP